MSAVLVQMVTLLGAGLESVAEPHIGPLLDTSFVAVAGGTFLYLGFHAVHSEWKITTNPADDAIIAIHVQWLRIESPMRQVAYTMHFQGSGVAVRRRHRCISTGKVVQVRQWIPP